MTKANWYSLIAVLLLAAAAVFLTRSTTSVPIIATLWATWGACAGIVGTNIATKVNND